MIWNRFWLAFRRAGRDPAARRAAATQARRWTDAAVREPELAEDVIRMGRVLVPLPRDPAEVLSLSPEQIAYELGRRDFALDLLAQMTVTPRDMRTLMEDPDD